MSIRTGASGRPRRMDSFHSMCSADPLVLEDYDYGIWYMDALEHPRKYEGETGHRMR